MPATQNLKLAFPGLRGNFLASQMDDYAEAVKNGSIQDTVAIIQRKFFKRFPLTLDDKEEPSAEWLAQVDDNTAEPELDVPNEDSMTPEEFTAAMAKHTDLVEKIDKKKDQILCCLIYMNKMRNGPPEKEILPNNLMALFKSKMGAGDLKKPRQKIPFNVWAAKNRATVDAEFAKRIVGVPVSQHAQLRSAVYKELFGAQPVHKQEAIIQEVAAQHALAMSEYEMLLKSGPSDSPQDRQRAIEYVPQFVEPLLDTIAEYTGWKWSLLGGGPEPAKGGRLSMISIHSGFTSGAVKMNFGRTERKAFRKQIMPLFGSFLKKCWTVEECKARALLPDHAATQMEALYGGGQWSEAYNVNEDDKDNNDDDENHSCSRNPALQKADENVRAMDRARAAAKKFSAPSTALTRMMSALDVYTPHSTSTLTVKIGPPLGATPAGKAKSKPSRQRLAKSTAKSLAEGAVPQSGTKSIAPTSTLLGAANPIRSAPAASLSKLSTMSLLAGVPRPQSPTISHPRSPAVSRPPTPVVSCPPSPIISCPASPIVPGCCSPSGSGPQSPAISQSHIVTLSSAPVVSSPSRLGSPVIEPPQSPVLSHPPSPTASHPLTGPFSPHAALVAVSGSTPLPPGLSGHAGVKQRVSSGAVAVPDVSIPEVGSVSHGTGSKKRKAAHTGDHADNTKRVRSSPSTSSSTQAGSSGAWEVSVPPDAPAWVIKAVKLLVRDDFGVGWQGLVDDWLQYKRASNFVHSGRLSSKGRPQAVADWIQRARSEIFHPTVNVTKFETEFKQWWMGLQSAPGEGGSWARLTGITSTNGLLSVLVVLVFWRGGLPTTTTSAAGLDAWSDAVESIRDILKKLN